MQANVQRNYKDGLFLSIFRDKQALLSLYNAIRGSNYTNPDDLTVNTLEKALYMGMKNDGEEACLECTATMININFGHNQPLMEACRELYEYAYLIEQVRIGTRAGLTLPDAIDQAVVHCIEHDILKRFLTHHRAEVTCMILKEFDLNKHIESEKAYSHEEGKNLILRLMQNLLDDNRMDDLAKISSDPELLEQLIREYKLSN